MQSFYAVLIFIGSAYTVPPDYCFTPLNQSDCKLEPTPVFSYYKPGSRCEIYFWRGCPTMNKFDNEYDCSNLCIAKLGDKRNIEKTEDIIPIPDLITTDFCMVPINSTNCSANETEVYTFRDGECLEAIWRGCPTQNKFTDEESCEKVCNKDQVVDIGSWKKKLKGLPVTQLEEVDNILDDIVEQVHNSSSTATPEVISTVITTGAEKVTETIPSDTPILPTVEQVTDIPTVKKTRTTMNKPTYIIGTPEEVITT